MIYARTIVLQVIKRLNYITLFYSNTIYNLSSYYLYNRTHSKINFLPQFFFFFIWGFAFTKTIHFSSTPRHSLDQQDYIYSIGGGSNHEEP